MKNNSVRNGLMMGLVSAIFYIMLYLVNKSLLLNVSLSFVISLVIPIVFMYMAIKAERDMNEGFISFSEALKVSFLAFVIGNIFPIVAQHLIFTMDADLIVLLKEKSIEMVEKVSDMMGASEEEKQEAMKAASEKDFSYTPGRSLLGYAGSLIFPGFILSLILSLILKRGNDA